MRNLMIWGIVILLAVPLAGQFKDVSDSEGNVYRVYVPQLTLPILTLPEVQKLSIAEIQALSPEVITATIRKLSIAEINVIEPIKLVYMVSRLTLQEIQTIEPAKLKVMITRPSTAELQMLQPETVAIVITQLQERDLDEVLQKIAPRGYWYAEQVKFFDAWKKRDIRAIASMVAKTRVEQLPFFTAWGNYSNFSEINWSRYEPFEYRQVLIQSVSHAKETISFDWREKFKPQSKIILTIDFDLDAKEVQALQEMISENKDKILMVVLPWGAQSLNNYDLKTPEKYGESFEYIKILFYAVKEVSGNIPVYLTVCLTPTMEAWLKSAYAVIKPDGLALWNLVYITQGAHQKVYDMLKGYNENIILSGIFQCQPDKSWRPWEEVKKSFTQKDLDKLKDIGYRGVIFMNNVVDTK